MISDKVGRGELIEANSFTQTHLISDAKFGSNPEVIRKNDLFVKLGFE